jgi:hypothetical protein
MATGWLRYAQIVNSGAALVVRPFFELLRTLGRSFSTVTWSDAAHRMSRARIGGRCLETPNSPFESLSLPSRPVWD